MCMYEMMRGKASMNQKLKSLSMTVNKARRDRGNIGDDYITVINQCA